MVGIEFVDLGDEEAEAVSFMFVGGVAMLM